MLLASYIFCSDTQHLGWSPPSHPAITLVLLSTERQVLELRGGLLPQLHLEKGLYLGSTLRCSSWEAKLTLRLMEEEVHLEGESKGKGNSCTLSHCCCDSLLLSSFFEYTREKGWILRLVLCK